MNDIKKRFEEFESEYGKFDKIPDDKKLHKNKQLCGLLYLYNLCIDDVDMLSAGDEYDDVIYLVEVDELKELSDEDIIYLLRCSISYDYEYDCLYIRI